MKTIKQRISYAVMGLMAMGFTACTQNEDMAPTLKGQEINATFSVGGMQTRVNTLGFGNNWEDKDKLKVSIFTDYDPGSTAVLSFNGETWSRSGSFRWLNEYEQHTILAVYPSDMDFGKNNLQYDLQTDQSSEGNLKNADLITGYWHDIPRYDLRIPMQHRMSLVTIFYEIGAYDHPNKDISNLRICSPCNGASFSRRSNTDWIMDTSNYKEPTLVYACQTGDDGEKSFSAIIVPGSLDTSADFLKFTLDGQDYTVKLKQKTDFLEGHRYIYSLRKIGRDKVELAVRNQGVLPGWENEEEL